MILPSDGVNGCFKEAIHSLRWRSSNFFSVRWKEFGLFSKKDLFESINVLPLTFGYLTISKSGIVHLKPAQTLISYTDLLYSYLRNRLLFCSNSR